MPPPAEWVFGHDVMQGIHVDVTRAVFSAMQETGITTVTTPGEALVVVKKAIDEVTLSLMARSLARCSDSHFYRWRRSVDIGNPRYPTAGNRVIESMNAIHMNLSRTADDHESTDDEALDIILLNQSMYGDDYHSSMDESILTEDGDIEWNP